MEYNKANPGYEENKYEDIERQINEAHKKRQQKRTSLKHDGDFLDEVIHAKNINKRVIEKVMLTYCGNEGAEHDERTRSLRKLLQAGIDYIQIHPQINWDNAEVTVYDIDDNSFKIISGEGKHQYVVADDGKGEVEVEKTGNKVQKQASLKQSQPTRGTAPSHNPAYEENNYEDIERQINEAHKKSQMKQKDAGYNDGFLDEVIQAKNINKRVIGKVMVTYCGNEGAEHDERTRSLRKLLQAGIDYIQVHTQINWDNAEFTVYDIDDNSFKIISGEGKHQYVVSDDGKGGIGVENTGNKVQKQKPVEQPQPNRGTAPAGLNRDKRSSYGGGFHPYSQPNGYSNHPSPWRQL